MELGNVNVAELELHKKYMRRANFLALHGLGNVSPNPLVGCVIVHKGKIIGEGYHKQYGGPHAEVNAINSVKNKGFLADSILYVTLEPCSHYGKTPPCADLIVEHKIPKVVIGHVDPFPEVSGKGIERLRKSGVEVLTRILEDESKWINRRFLTSILDQRPYIILKWAETRDKFIARTNYDSKWISNRFSRKLVHKWRAEEDGILVGRNTAEKDNPRLNVREWSGHNPVRIVLDPDLRLSQDLNLFKDIETIVFNRVLNEDRSIIKFRKITDSATFDFKKMLDELTTQKIQSVIVEGGTNTLNMFIDSGVWDEARVFVSREEFKEGIPAPGLSLTPNFEQRIEEDKLRVYYNGRGVNR